jgi:hypothetical protein
MTDVVVSLSWGQVGLLVAGPSLAVAGCRKWIVKGAEKISVRYRENKIESPATSRDDERLVAQTCPTKHAKGDVVDAMWGRQFGWAYMKDTLLQILKAFFELKQAVRIYETELILVNLNKDPKRVSDALSRLELVGAQFEQLRVLAIMIGAFDIANLITKTGFDLQEAAANTAGE